MSETRNEMHFIGLVHSVEIKCETVEICGDVE